MTILEELRRDESRVLDRLVDGELSQHERRELLAALDDEPGAWRRCALAFLEAQSWRWQLAHVAAEPIVAQLTAANSAAPQPRASGRALSGACLAMAASLLVAFGLGTRYSNSGQPQIASSEAPTSVANQPATAIAVVDATDPDQLANSDEGDWQEEPVSEAVDETSWETVTLALADDAATAGADDKFEVRVRDLEAGDADLSDLIGGEPSSLTAALLEQLEQEGWKITRERHLVPVNLSDGRRMVVPVEQVDFHSPDSARF